MSVIDDYLQKVEASKRKDLTRIRKLAKEVVPSAQETISYGMPTLKYCGEPFLGFNAHANHIGIYPYGAAPIRLLRQDLRAYRHSSGAIRVPLDDPIPKSLLVKLIKCKIALIKAGAKKS